MDLTEGLEHGAMALPYHRLKKCNFGSEQCSRVMGQIGRYFWQSRKPLVWKQRMRNLKRIVRRQDFRELIQFREPPRHHLARR